ncbi:ribonuclease H-like domain-containing protein [Tanacetum coccineum]
MNQTTQLCAHGTTPPTSPPQPDTPPSHSSTPIPLQPDTNPSHSSTPILNSAQTQSHAQTVDSHTPIPINNSSQTMPTNPMVTRVKAGIFKSLKRMNCHVTTTSPLPRSHIHALRDLAERSLSSSSAFLQRITTSLHSEFAMTDLEEILERAHMQNCNPCWTPVDTESKLGSNGDPVSDPTLYRSLAGALYAKAEYQGVANVVAETAWIRNLLCELHTPLFTATLVYCDNVSAVYMSANPVQHQRTKHIEIDIHFVRDFVASGQVRVLHVPSRFQYADIFTKGLPTALFIEFRSSLNVRRSPAHTEGEY